MRKAYKIDWFEHNEEVIYCPRSIVDECETKLISFGSFQENVVCLPHPNKQNVFALSYSLANRLKIPKFLSKINVFTRENTIYFGPLIGIFTNGFTSFKLSPIGQRSSMFSKLLSVQSSIGVVPFLFGENHIDWENGVVKGHFYHDNMWETYNIPLPNVVYDRLPNRRSEKGTQYKEIKHRLQNQYGIPWYNPGFFNKLEVFEKIENHPEAAAFLPETHSLQSFSQIETMISKYSTVFIKPINGSLGLGILQLYYSAAEENYYCRMQDKKGKNRLYRFSSLEKLCTKLISPKSFHKMIVQQGIKLIQFEKRKIDFRVHTNKDESGEWQVSALAAKVAGQGSVTTHIHNGGLVKSLSEVFPDDDLRHRSEAMLMKTALCLSSAIEENMNGYIGEIGFDFGIDTEGNIWLFEANSKPGRSIFSHPDLKEFDLLTRQLSLSFGIYLAGQSLTATEELVT
ncbi:hypothetical protein JOC86_002958 [Bacillus pakistanensis]|uniref:YheC/YheD family protein n=1 Tax=Rossellomorea pakistanensis TaxID=992288 RepID=A0ABS2NFR4_9BACI|nr:YheC/YheD family protein [Bacillus pakistanensis]MBM7586406.1 hypothetical protein [Bacillus pakistanensis]